MTPACSRFLRFSVLLGLVAVLGTGCASSSMGRYDVKIRLADSLSDSTGILPSVEVHVMALNTTNGRILQDFSMSDYWNPNRKRDPFIKHIMRFGEGKQSVQVLSRRDPIWKRWAGTGASYLFVMADLQGIYEDKKDVTDPRRLILPLDPARWQNRSIQIMIEKTGVFCQTRRLPKAKK